MMAHTFKSEKHLRSTSLAARSLLLLTLVLCNSAAGEGVDLSQLSIEELMNIEVTTVSKKLEPMSNAPAAVFVVTGDDISRSGYTTIPDVLRLVPGLEVAQIDLNTWAISSRGFNSQLASKLLVMIDGRSIYSPLFSGVFWDVQDLMIEDIDRIEVVRGPGATMWGANAVNGVINIITKSSADTRGGFASTRVANAENIGGELRYGSAINSRTSYRVFAKGFDNRIEPGSQGPQVNDSWKSLRGGFRIDSELNCGVKSVVSGNVHSNQAQYAMSYGTIAPPYFGFADKNLRSAGGDLTLRLDYSSSPKSHFSLQTYVDRLDYDHPAVRDLRTTADASIQHTWTPSARHEVVSGMEYRSSWDNVTNGFIVSTDQPKFSMWLYSGFVQESFSIIPQTATLTLGSKFERNSLTDWELQPSARLLVTPSHGHKVWCSAARAARIPSRLEMNGRYMISVLPPMTAMNPAPLPVQIVGEARDPLDSEKLVAYEVGYRVQPHRQFAADICAFYNDYSDLRGVTTAEVVQDIMTPTPSITQYLVFGNNAYAKSYGGEFSLDWRPSHLWRLRGGYTYLNLTIKSSTPNDPSNAIAPPEYDSVDPRNQVWLENSFSPYSRLDFNFVVRYADRLRFHTVPSHFVADARVAYDVSDGLELYAVAQNLFGGAYYEFESDFSIVAVARPTEPRVFAGVTWEFPEFGK